MRLPSGYGGIHLDFVAWKMRLTFFINFFMYLFLCILVKDNVIAL